MNEYLMPASILAIATIISLGFAWYSYRGTENRVVFYLFGFFAAVILGLSESPLLPAIATGIFSVLAAGVVLWKHGGFSQQLDEVIQRIKLPVSLILAGAILGLPAGIAMKANDVLSFQPQQSVVGPSTKNNKALSNETKTKLRAGETKVNIAELWELHALPDRTVGETIVNIQKNANEATNELINSLESYKDDHAFVYQILKEIAEYEQ